MSNVTFVSEILSSLVKKVVEKAREVVNVVKQGGTKSERSSVCVCMMT
jgi:hypothetical protein